MTGFFSLASAVRGTVGLVIGHTVSIAEPIKESA
jgi:hypothetical protein